MFVTPALPSPIGGPPTEESWSELEHELFVGEAAPLGHANLDDVEANRKRLNAKKGAGNGAKPLEPLLLIGDIPANH